MLSCGERCDDNRAQAGSTSCGNLVLSGPSQKKGELFMRRKSFVMAAVLVMAVSCACHAQTYEDWSATPQTASSRSFSTGVQLGMPYVLGVDVASHFNSRMSAGLGFGFVPDLVTFGGQFRLSMMEPGADKTVPFASAGINQYWIEDAGKNTEAVAVNFLVGVDHFFGSSTSLGMHIGYINTLTKSDDNRVKVWGVNDDMSKLFLGVSGRYYF